MKNYVILSILLISSLSAFSQKNNRDAAIADLEAARSFLSNGNKSDAEIKLVSAKNSIELAQKSQQTTSDFKTLMAMGDIYYELNSLWAVNKPDESHGAGVKSRDGYVRAKAVTTKSKELEAIDKQLRNLQINTYNQGVDQLNASAFEPAKKCLMLSMELAESRGEVDGQQLFITGMTCDMVGDYEKAYGFYRKCASMDYGDAKLYASMLNTAVIARNDEWIKTTIAEGKAKFPKDREFTLAVANAYLMTEEYERAEETLQEAIQRDMSNVSLIVALGAVYEKLGKTDRAIETYVSALSKDPSNFDASYGLGAIYYNEAVSIQLELNNMDFGATGTKELTEKHKQSLQKGRKYLEKAHEVNSTDYGTVSALMTIYAQLELMEEYSKMKSALNRIKSGE